MSSDRLLFDRVKYRIVDLYEEFIEFLSTRQRIKMVQETYRKRFKEDPQSRDAIEKVYNKFKATGSEKNQFSRKVRKGLTQANIEKIPTEVTMDPHTLISKLSAKTGISKKLPEEPLKIKT